MIRKCLIPLLLVLGLAACDRPFVDVRVPVIEVIEPDPDVIQTNAKQTLRIRASSFREITTVLLDGAPMTQTPDGLWEATVQFSLGVNAFEVTALDADETPGVDTLQFVHVLYRFDNTPRGWSEATGGHAAAALPDGDVLITGGAQRVDGQALARIVQYNPARGTFAPREFRMAEGRLGHTMTPLGNGEFIIAGGSRVPFPDAIGDLVEIPERLSLEDGRSRPMFVDGPPIRRAYHTASLRQTASGLVLELLGGLGDVRYIPQPLFGVRDDLRRFLVRGDTLIAINTAPGFFIERLAGHVQIDLDRSPPTTPSTFLVAGAVFDGIFNDQYAFRMDTAAPTGIELRDIPNPGTGRFGASGELLAPGLVLRVGGRTAFGLPPEPTGDLFAAELDRFFSLAPDLVTGAPPVLHGSATFVQEDRILLLGGFSSSGSAYTPVTYFVVEE